MKINLEAFQARLHFVGLGSQDPERLVAFYKAMFEMDVDRRGDQWMCCGRTRKILIGKAPTRSFLAAGYAVKSPEALEALVKRTGASKSEDPFAWDGLFASETVLLKDPDGNTMVFGVAPEGSRDVGDDNPAGRLQHVVFGTTALDRLVEFYSQSVGFRISDTVVDEHGVTKTVFLRSDEEHHSLAVFQTSENRLDHHCYEAYSWNSLRDWGDRLAAHRVPVKWGPGRHGPGNNLFLFFHDPDDNWLEISTELEVVEESRPIGRWPHEERTLNSWGRGYLRT